MCEHERLRPAFEGSKAPSSTAVILAVPSQSQYIHFPSFLLRLLLTSSSFQLRHRLHFAGFSFYQSLSPWLVLPARHLVLRIHLLNFATSRTFRHALRGTNKARYEEPVGLVLGQTADDRVGHLWAGSDGCDCMVTYCCSHPFLRAYLSVPKKA